MYFLGIFLLMLCDSSRGFPVPIDSTILQVQQWGVVGYQQVVEQVLLNGVPLAGNNQEMDRIIKTMSASPILPALISVNHTSVLRNLTLLRSRECVLEGSQMHWVDHMFCDGELCLTLDHTDTWKAEIPQALALKLLWDQEMQRTRMERIRLQEGCAKLMKELRLSQEQPASRIPLPHFLIPILALLAFGGLAVISLLLSKSYGQCNRLSHTLSSGHD
ncbi:uncharacterized protein LOC117827323 [Xyrichtys novacula]|uniref:Uncharacterized protein LOC117827323 n=1 Tax=Xyrichtys novacula TaxID=13765 RepID=A0AAV1GGD2_XYRNO|nr:uncharacterized protein LOC117827323 [Xyrichtys novacula]